MAKKVLTVLTADTMVFGYFKEIEISFTIGDCSINRADNGVNKKKNHNNQIGARRHYIFANNIRKIDDRPGGIPAKLSLCDGRLTGLSVSKEKICNYFRTPRDNSDSNIIPKSQKKKEKKRQVIRRNSRVYH